MNVFQLWWEPYTLLFCMLFSSFIFSISHLFLLAAFCHIFLFFFFFHLFFHFIIYFSLFIRPSSDWSIHKGPIGARKPVVPGTHAYTLASQVENTLMSLICYRQAGPFGDNSNLRKPLSLSLPGLSVPIHRRHSTPDQFWSTLLSFPDRPKLIGSPPDRLKPFTHFVLLLRTLFI